MTAQPTHDDDGLTKRERRALERAEAILDEAGWTWRVSRLFGTHGPATGRYEVVRVYGPGGFSKPEAERRVRHLNGDCGRDPGSCRYCNGGSQ